MATLNLQPLSLHDPFVQRAVADWLYARLRKTAGGAVRWQCPRAATISEELAGFALGVGIGDCEL